MRILKDFKCFVWEVRILKELRAHFAEVRILKGLGCVWAVQGTIEVGWKLDSKAEGAEFTEGRER